MKESLKKVEISRQVMKEFTCPTKAWMFSKQRFECVSDDQSVLHKLL